jgi:hypothetical protein
VHAAGRHGWLQTFIHDGGAMRPSLHLALLFVLLVPGFADAQVWSAATGTVTASDGRTYGTASKTFLTLSPSNFRPERSTLTYQNNDNQVGVGNTMSRTGGPGEFFRAPFHLPEGALLTEVAFVFCDTSPIWDFQSELVIQPRLGILTGRQLISPGSAGTPGCVDQTVVLDPPVQIDNRENYYEIWILLGPADTTIQFASARVAYLLQVSPAPAVATFNDVPANHIFFRFIEALAAAGITGGCSVNPPLYCPDDPVTRGQMAVFISRALGLHWAP